ncbi:MAG: tRNA (adenosine(37)-N6)-dimethylallyltransferase MiaA [Rhodospirillales bacterium]|nr:tRNA (adenosine(37)-N6)-dimethylallyltransferase MiaA [Rhodospirillales bacterium]
MNSATDNTRPVLIVAGPTASGKSSMAMDIAAEFDGVIINADSMQVYQNLRILTARPDKADEARVPHRLYGVIPPSQNCSVAHWRDLAVAEVETVLKAGQLPVVTGGTGMYIRALMQGLAPIPEGPAEIRLAVQAGFDKNGGTALHAELSECDPESAARIDVGDKQRLIRAVEIYRATETPLSHWISLGNEGGLSNVMFQPLILMPPREALYERIDARFHQMINEGALDEVGKLLELGLDSELSAMKAVGVRELAGYLAGDLTLELAVSSAQQASRNYAKRQMTWFRNQIPEAETVFAQYSESQRPKIFSFVRQFLLTNPV